MIHIITAAPSNAGRSFDPESSICVNRGIIGRECRHWVAGDTFTVNWVLERQKPPAYDCRLWTMKNENPTPKYFAHVGRFDLLPGWTALPGGHANWSIQGAVALAVHLWLQRDLIGRVVIHGTEAYFDKITEAADSAGFAGEQADRGADRWKREREDLDLSISWAQSKGATVYLDRT